MKIKRAIKALGLKVQRISKVSESHSSDVRILRLKNGEELVLKLPWNRAKFVREKATLKALAKLDFVPKLLKTLDGAQPALLMTRLPGKPIGHVKNCSPALARQIGRTLAKAKKFTLPMQKGDANWARMLKEHGMHSLKLCREDAPSPVWAKAEAAFQKGLALLPKTSKLRFVHFDFRLGNLLQKNGKLTGMIDFESSRNGSPDFDICALLLRDGFGAKPSLKKAFFRGYGPKPKQLEKLLPFYQLYGALACMAFCCKRGRGRGDAFYEKNLKIMIKVISRKSVEHGS